MKRREENEYIKGLRERLRQVGEEVVTIRNERMRLLENASGGNKEAMRKLRDCTEKLERAQREEEEVFADLADAMEQEHPELKE